MGTLVLAGRYEIIEKIGDGGMAVVYKARDKQLNRFVAIKILKKEFITDQTFVENFIREAKAAASLLHPNIVTIYDTGKDRDIYYIVMEYVEGRALSEVIAEEAPLDYKRCIRIAKQVASALSLAHRNHIIHRDVKPHNILITPDGTAKITDFGIAKAVSDGTIINDSGTIMGSVHYFSPEQSRGQYVDEKSDIYSLGIVLYEMITGRVPFDADNPVTIAVMHMNDTIIPPSRLVKGVPPGLDQIVMKATAKYQSDRFSNIDEMYKALDNVNFITGIIDDPVIAGYVAPTNMVDETPGQGSSSAVGTDEDDYNSDSNGDADKPDYGNDEDGESDDEDDEEEKSGFFARLFGGDGKSRLTKNQKIILIIIIVAIAIALSFPISKLIMGAFSTEMVVVPDVVGMEVEEATEVLKAEGFSAEIEIVALPAPASNALVGSAEDTDTLVLDDTSLLNNTSTSQFKEGEVMEQDPEGGETAKKGSTVNLKVAGPPESSDDDLSDEILEVPDLLGKTKASAEYAISAAGFRIGTVTYESSDSAVDQVIAQTPKSGEQAPGNSVINIVISTGPKVVSVSVPNLSGKTSTEAAQALANVNLKLGSTSEASSDQPKGTVIGQSPTAGTKVNEESSVNITISSGPAQASVPNVVGMTPDQAKLAIESAGLTYSRGADIEDASRVGVVSVQTPTSGTTADKGTTVTCRFGVAPAATITGVSISGGPATVSAGGNAGFSATVSGTGSYNTGVTWSVSGGDGSSTINNGTLTVGSSETSGTVLTITATASGDSTKSASTTATVS